MAGAPLYDSADMARTTLLGGTVAAGEGVVLLAPNWASASERWLASISEPHLSQIAIGVRRIPLREALEDLRDSYLGADAPDWNVLARLEHGQITLQPLEDLEHSPGVRPLTVKAGHSTTLRHPTAFAALCQHGQGVIGRAAIGAPSTVLDGRLHADEVFIVGEAARRGVAVRNASATEPLVLLLILSEESWP